MLIPTATTVAIAFVGEKKIEKEKSTSQFKLLTHTSHMNISLGYSTMQSSSPHRFGHLTLKPYETKRKKKIRSYWLNEFWVKAWVIWLGWKHLLRILATIYHSWWICNVRLKNFFWHCKTKGLRGKHRLKLDWPIEKFWEKKSRRVVEYTLCISLLLRVSVKW